MALRMAVKIKRSAGNSMHTPEQKESRVWFWSLKLDNLAGANQVNERGEIHMISIKLC